MYRESTANSGQPLLTQPLPSLLSHATWPNRQTPPAPMGSSGDSAHPANRAKRATPPLPLERLQPFRPTSPLPAPCLLLLAPLIHATPNPAPRPPPASSPSGNSVLDANGER